MPLELSLVSTTIFSVKVGKSKNFTRRKWKEKNFSLKVLDTYYTIRLRNFWSSKYELLLSFNFIKTTLFSIFVIKGKISKASSNLPARRHSQFDLKTLSWADLFSSQIKSNFNKFELFDFIRDSICDKNRFDLCLLIFQLRGICLFHHISWWKKSNANNRFISLSA